MKRFQTPVFLTGLLLAMAATSLSQDQPGQPGQDGMLNAQIRLRESRVAAKQELLKTTDERLESGIAQLVALLQAANDSPETRIRVTLLKEQVAKALAKSIGYYRQKRQDTRGALERPDLDYQPEDLRRGLAALDERIEKRITQIIEITRSLEVHKEFEKYLVEYEDSDYGWDDNKRYRKSKDWAQDRRVTALTDQDRRLVEDALTKNIEDLDRRERDLKSRLTTATGAAKDLMEEDLADVNRQQGIRASQLSELKVPTAEAAAGVDMERAKELQALVKDMSEDLREDFFAIFRLYNELLVERRDLARLKEKASK